MNTVVLVTMVRNESRILGRMLASTVGVADRAVVVDTGSTDDTVALAELEERGRLLDHGYILW